MRRLQARVAAESSASSIRMTCSSVGSLSRNRGDLAPIEVGRRDQHAGAADGDARRERFGTEGGEQRRHDAAVLQRAEHRDIEFGDAAEQHIDALAGLNAERSQSVREAVGRDGEIAVGDVARRPRLADPSQGDPIFQRSDRVTVDRLMGDVQPGAARETAKALASRIPIKSGARRLVIDQIWTELEGGRVLSNRRVAPDVAS